MLVDPLLSLLMLLNVTYHFVSSMCDFGRPGLLEILCVFLRGEINIADTEVC